MATTLIKEKEIKNLVRKTVIQSLQEILNDPDYGLEITENLQSRLKKYSKNPAKKLTSLNKIKERYL
jgi:signal recognition particle GTPase